MPRRPELRGTAFGLFNLVTGLALLAASLIAVRFGRRRGRKALFSRARICRADPPLPAAIPSPPRRAPLPDSVIMMNQLDIELTHWINSWAGRPRPLISC